MSRAVRRIALTGVVALCCCSAAQAAVLAHPGKPVTSGPRTFAGLQAYPRTLVELDHVRGAAAVPALRRAGGRLIEPSLALWRLPSWTAQQLLPGLQRRGLVRSVTPDVPIGTDPRGASGFFGQFTDPLSPQEWWPSHIGVSEWIAPGPGVPVTMIDSGVDLSHEEFAGRPNTIALNTQTFDANQDELHGTATASVVAAPVNGKGIVGIYPQAKLQLWDASPTGQLTVGDEIAGLAAARRHGQGVINLSLGGFDRLPIEEHAILSAFGAGLLVVASSGNDREEGSSPSFPASFAHVLTVGATDEADRVTVFSSASPAMDLAAPGQDIETAIPTLFDPSRLRLARRHELLGPARLRRRRGGLDAAADAVEHTAVRGHAPLGARRRQGRLGPGHRLRHPRRPRRVDAQAAGRRPAGAERRRLPGEAERAHA